MTPLPDEEEIERMARALAIADNKDPDGFAWIRPGGRPTGVVWRDQYFDMARAAHSASRQYLQEKGMGVAKEMTPALCSGAVMGCECDIDPINCTKCVATAERINRTMLTAYKGKDGG